MGWNGKTHQEYMINEYPLTKENFYRMTTRPALL